MRRDTFRSSEYVQSTGRYELVTASGLYLQRSYRCVAGNRFPVATATAPGVEVRYVLTTTGR